MFEELAQVVENRVCVRICRDERTTRRGVRSKECPNIKDLPFNLNQMFGKESMLRMFQAPPAEFLFNFSHTPRVDRVNIIVSLDLSPSHVHQLVIPGLEPAEGQPALCCPNVIRGEGADRIVSLQILETESKFTSTNI